MGFTLVRFFCMCQNCVFFSQEVAFKFEDSVCFVTAWKPNICINNKPVQILAHLVKFLKSHERKNIVETVRFLMPEHGGKATYMWCLPF